MVNTKKRPFLKWAGSKYRCLDKILLALPQGERLIEPFTGSGAVFLNTHYSRYLLAENNPDLVRLFQILKEEGLTFIEACRTFFTIENNKATQYYDYRATFNQTICERQRAMLLVYLNRHGFNGLCRYNQKGKYNVPFGRYKTPYFPAQEMLYFHEKSAKAEFIEADFRTTLEQAMVGDVIYCDPPYVPLSKSASFATYSGKAFGENEQKDLVELAIQCAKKGIPVIISNHDTPWTRKYYQSAEIFSFSMRRQISCLANHRLIAPELIAIFQA